MCTTYYLQNGDCRKVGAKWEVSRFRPYTSPSLTSAAEMSALSLIYLLVGLGQSTYSKSQFIRLFDCDLQI
ncbi:hypothetical protein PM082_021539 [Marasmius tenuissimus]|nr:hypothetical protein PM082_021539 [Marasmius tenuissimus]